MNIFGLTITRTKQMPSQLSPVPTRGWGGSGGWYPIVREPYAGAWQQNMAIVQADVIGYSTVFACISLIASDIAKLPILLLERDSNGIWSETENPAYSPVLRKPNHYTTRVKFFEYWMISKLIHGNTYVLKSRDGRGVVDALYVLDPTRCKPLVAPDGAVFYQLSSDTLAGLEEHSLVVPASEIIHDINVPLFHPLCGVSPIFACGLAAQQGLTTQKNTTQLLGKGSQLSGLLSFPGMLSEEAMNKFAEYWEQNYVGEHNVGKVAIVSGGMKFEPMTMTATDAQLIEQLNWTDQTICAVFHVPQYKILGGTPPPYTDLQSIQLEYYQNALQNPMENIEALLDEGLSLPSNIGVEFDIDALARMDTKTQTDIAVARVGGGIDSPNEARAKFSRKPVKGGDSPMMQQQMYSLEALSKRDAAPPSPAPGPAVPEPPPATKDLSAEELRAELFTAMRLKRAA